MKNIFVLILGIFLANELQSQEVDYVINNPKYDKNEQLVEKIESDTNTISNPDYTAYFLNSSAYTLDKKKIRLSGTDAIFVKGSYGLTDNTTASVNLSMLGTFTASIKQQITISDQAKLGLSVSGGQLIFADADLTTIDSTMFLMGGQAMVTLGDRQNNLTIGTGLYYIKGTFDILGNNEKSFLTHNIYVAFQKQIGKKWYIMAEGMYYLSHGVFTGALGAKVVVGDRVSLNFGLMPFGFNDPSNSTTTIEPIPIPLISFRYLLGRDR